MQSQLQKPLNAAALERGAREDGVTLSVSSNCAAQVFPYFYVPYDDDLPADPAAAHTYLRDLAQGIEIAMRANSQVSVLFTATEASKPTRQPFEGAFLCDWRKVVTTFRRWPKSTPGQ